MGKKEILKELLKISESNTSFGILDSKSFTSDMISFIEKLKKSIKMGDIRRKRD